VAEEQRATAVERDEVAVMFKRVAAEQTAISRGWVELEEAVGSLRGRKFYGAFDQTSREYRVCVQRRESDEPSALGLEVGTLPGGRYAGCGFRANRPLSTNSSPLRSKRWPSARTTTTPARASRFTGGGT
jgi:hypothetical protein